jgi:hypothetical protein
VDLEYDSVGRGGRRGPPPPPWRGAGRTGRNLLSLFALLLEQDTSGFVLILFLYSIINSFPDKDQKVLVRAGNEPDFTDMRHLAKTTRQPWLLLVCWYF